MHGNLAVVVHFHSEFEIKKFLNILRRDHEGPTGDASLLILHIDAG
jgi:hypothetical protein